jgi:signal recognition particle subunit SRP54
MFDTLGSRLQAVFASFRAEVKLSPEVVERGLREIRIALLEADVNFKVTKAFIDRVRDRAVGRDVLESLTPAQQLIGVVRDELISLFGKPQEGLTDSANRPRVVLLVGLQGAGKTTTTAKLGRWLTKKGFHPLLVSTDIRRPAAIEQLSILGHSGALRVHVADGISDPVSRAVGAVKNAREMGYDVVLVDTAGRLHIDEELMGELKEIRSAVNPTDVFFVADAMTGQDAIKSAGEFHAQMGVTGVVMSKTDGDARGGAALSVVSVVGVPVVFAATGERLEDLELFRADRLVSRMLGMGDVLSLVERAEQAIEPDEAVEMVGRLRRNNFTLEDLRNQVKALGRMGPLNQVMNMIPGLGKLAPSPEGVDKAQLGRVVAIIDSMTPSERQKPNIINGSRRLRVARGSGTSVQEVNRVMKQYGEMRKMLKVVSGSGRGKGKRKRGRFTPPAMPSIRSLARG